MLLVVLIFLMLSTTYSRFTELQINLPAADAEKLRERPAEDHRVGRQRRPLCRQPQGRRRPQRRAADAPSWRPPRPAGADTVVIISADAMAAHQSVINVLDAARRAGLSRLTFAAQTGDGASAADASRGPRPDAGRVAPKACWRVMVAPRPSVAGAGAAPAVLAATRAVRRCAAPA